jgi:hypothetical protein
MKEQERHVAGSTAAFTDSITAHRVLCTVAAYCGWLLRYSMPCFCVHTPERLEQTSYCGGAHNREAPLNIAHGPSPGRTLHHNHHGCFLAQGQHRIEYGQLCVYPLHVKGPNTMYDADGWADVAHVCSARKMRSLARQVPGTQLASAADVLRYAVALPGSQFELDVARDRLRPTAAARASVRARAAQQALLAVAHCDRWLDSHAQEVEARGGAGETPPDLSWATQAIAARPFVSHAHHASVAHGSTGGSSGSLRPRWLPTRRAHREALHLCFNESVRANSASDRMNTVASRHLPAGSATTALNCQPQQHSQVPSLPSLLQPLQPLRTTARRLSRSIAHQELLSLLSSAHGSHSGVRSCPCAVQNCAATTRSYCSLCN